MHLSTLIVASALVTLAGGCASHPGPGAQVADPDLMAPPSGPVTSSWAEPPTVGADVQFTVADRKAKSSPDDAANAGTFQTTRANTSGLTTSGQAGTKIRTPQ